MTQYRVVIPEEEHSIVEFVQRNLPGFATVNVALRSFEPKLVFPWHLSVLINCDDVSINRLPSQAEQDVLTTFEERLDTELKARGNALFFARVTHDARRELIWRVHDPDIADAVLRMWIEAKRFPRPFDYRMEQDEGWKKTEWYFSAAGGALQ